MTPLASIGNGVKKLALYGIDCGASSSKAAIVRQDGKSSVGAKGACSTSTQIKALLG